jgi:outer membrane protein assembly factor BamB
MFQRLIILLSISFLFLMPVLAQKKAPVRSSKISKDWVWQYSAKQDFTVSDRNEEVILLTSTFDETKKKSITAIDAKTGKVKWKVDTDDFYSNLTGESNFVIARIGKFWELINVSDGKTRMKISPLTDSFVKKLKVIGKSLYLAMDEEGIVVLDLDGGQKKWSYRPCFDLDDQIEITDKYLIVPCLTNNVFVADAENGQQIWSKNYYNDRINGLFIYNDLLITAVGYSGGNGGVSESFDVKTGKIVWSQRLEKGNVLEVSKIYRNKLYIGYLYGSFWILDAETGEILREFNRDDEGNTTKTLRGTEYFVTTAITSISAFGNTVIGAAEDGGLFAFDTETNEIRWAKTFPIYTSVLAQNDEFSLIDENGTVKIITNKDGKSAGKITAPINEAFNDSSNNWYVINGRRNLYKFSKVDISNALKTKRSVNLPKFPIKKEAQREDRIVASIRRSFPEFREQYSLPTSGNLSNNKFYLTHAGFESGELIEIDSQTGEKSTVFTTEGRLEMDQPVIFGEVAYFASEKFIYAVDIKLKTLIWKVAANSNFAKSQAANSNMTKSLIVSDEKIFFQDETGQILAIDRNDGSIIWRTGKLETNSSFLVWENTLVKINANQTVSLLNAKNGSVEKNLEVKNAANLAISGDILIVCENQENLTGYDLRLGKEAWTNFFGVGWRDSQTVSSGILLINTFFEQISAIDTKTGKTIWERVAHYKYFVSGDNLFVLNASGKLFIVNSLSGAIEKTFENNELQNSEIFNVKDNKFLFVKNNKTDEIAKFDFQSNKILWKIKFKLSEN